VFEFGARVGDNVGDNVGDDSAFEFGAKVGDNVGARVGDRVGIISSLAPPPPSPRNGEVGSWLTNMKVSALRSAS